MTSRNSEANAKPMVITDHGECVEAVEPVIISASRSTDIPAWYSEWFFNRLRKGYCVWKNVFNRKSTYVSFRRCRAVVFWTKNPEPIMPYLHELDERGIHYYFQITLNDYVAEGFEPNVPSVEHRVEVFKRLSEKIGRERVIWRFDPLIVTPDLTPRMLLERIRNVGNMLKGYTDKLVFSFVDVAAYKKVRENLVKETSCFTKETVCSAEMTETQRKELVEGLAALRDEWKRQGWRLTLATCGEEADLENYGIEHNRCIDGELMKRVFADDEDFVYYLETGELPEHKGQLDLFGAKHRNAKQWKDKGQRKACGCMQSKDIGMYDTCRHFCVYCYANKDRDLVRRNAAKHSPNSEGLIE